MMHTHCTLARSALAVSLALGLGLPAWAEEGASLKMPRSG